MKYECHYCGSEKTKPVVKSRGKVYLVKCLEPQGNEAGRWCKRTTIPQMEQCGICKKEFEFRFDPGWNEHIICFPCRQQKMKEYFEDPEVKKILSETIMRVKK